MDDFTTVVEEIRRSNAEEAKRDRNLNLNINHLKKVVEDTGSFQARVAVEAHNRSMTDMDDVSDAIDNQTAAFVGPLMSSADDSDDDTPPSAKAEKEDDKKKNQQTLVELLGGIGDGGVSSSESSADDISGPTNAAVWLSIASLTSSISVMLLL
jgi:uncharacterized protein